MMELLFLFRPLLTLGLFFLMASILRLLTVGTARAMLGNMEQEKKTAKIIETYLMTVVVRLAKYIRMDEYERDWTHNMLKVSGTDMTPEMYQMYVSMRAGTILLGITPCALLLPLLLPVVIISPLLTHFKESQKVDKWLKVKQDRVEGELPQLMVTIEQEPKASRNVVCMLERFKGSAGAILTVELDILLAGMCSSNYEAALTRFEARLNSPVFPDVVRGLIGTLCGDDSSVYSRMLVHDFKQLELQKLKAQAQKIPSKIRVFPLAMLMYFLLAHLVIIAYIAVASLGGMF